MVVYECSQGKLLCSCWNLNFHESYCRHREGELDFNFENLHDLIWNLLLLIINSHEFTCDLRANFYIYRFWGNVVDRLGVRTHNLLQVDRICREKTEKSRKVWTINQFIKTNNSSEANLKFLIITFLMKQREDYNRQLFRIIHDEIKTINFTSLPNETVDRGKQKKQLKMSDVATPEWAERKSFGTGDWRVKVNNSFDCANCRERIFNFTCGTQQRLAKLLKLLLFMKRSLYFWCGAARNLIYAEWLRSLLQTCDCWLLLSLFFFTALFFDEILVCAAKSLLFHVTHMFCL